MLSSDVKCAQNTTKLLLCLIDMLKLDINIPFILFAGIRLYIHIIIYLLKCLAEREKKSQIIISKGVSLAQVFLPSLGSANS